MPEQTTETPTTPTEGTSEAAATNLLSSTEGAATTEQPGAAAEAAKPAEAGAKPAEEVAKPAEQAKPEGAPEKYEFKAPDGKQYDAAVLEPFSEAAKAANLTQDAAQKILETMAPKLAEHQQAQVEAVQSGWLEASKTDKEFGGDRLQENLAVAKRALDTFAPKNADGTVSGFRQLLDDTGLGNHPEVIRMLVKIGKAISEDGFVAGSPKTSDAGGTAAILYDKTK